jgi:hypothetical protein
MNALIRHLQTTILIQNIQLYVCSKKSTDLLLFLCNHPSNGKIILQRLKSKGTVSFGRPFIILWSPRFWHRTNSVGAVFNSIDNNQFHAASGQLCLHVQNL